jgi:dTDP-4-dehydrorhamnose reductase
MRDKILILGKGFIGLRLQEELKCEISDARISSVEDAEKLIAAFSPDTIINCIGFIGRNVDDCELNRDKALESNTFIPVILAEAALRNNIRLVHISSGCIYHYDYSRNIPIGEDLMPDFLDLYYSRTKIYAEGALGTLSGKYPILIIRIRVPLDDRPHPRNILTKLLGYKTIIDPPNSITYIPDFVKALRHLIKADARGIYNITNKGDLRYPELLDVYRKYVPDFDYEVIDYKKLHMVRTNLVLSTKKLEDTGFKVRDIHEVLEECVREYIKY